MECTFCKKIFKNKYVLDTHQTTAQYCLQIQKKSTRFVCEYCDKHLSTKRWLINHYQTCMEYRVTMQTNEYKEKISSLEVQLEKYERTIKELQDKLENIAIKAVQKSTTTNVKNTQINYIQKMQPITQEYLLNHTPHLTIEHIKKGASGYAEYALEGPLKDRIACVDYSRRKIKFKDREGNIITDPEMAKLAPMFFDSIKDKSSQLVYSLNTVDMDSVMFEGVAKLFNTNADVKNGATGIKTDFYHDFIKHVCSGSVVE